MPPRLKTNLHTHTVRCRHAADVPDRAFVEAAIEAGVETLGFSDHCPWPDFPEDWDSHIRMPAREVPGYFESIAALREEFAGRIRILIGFEAEHLPKHIPAQDALFERYRPDYLILGQHFLGEEWDNVWCGFAGESESALARYVERVIAGLETGRYLYLAHPDVARFTGPEAVWEKHMRPLCEWLAAHDSPVEVNLLGLATRRHYPSDRFLRLAASCGCRAVLGVDAHDPAQFLDPAPEALARAMCARAGLALGEPTLPNAPR